MGNAPLDVPPGRGYDEDGEKDQEDEEVTHKILTTLAASVILAGCMYSQTGTRFDISKADQLQPNVSTEADAETLLGKPIQITTNPTNNHHLLVWQYVYGTALATNGGKQLAISFDEKRKMIKVIQRLEL